MHPIERLRYVARAEGAGPSALVREAAGALAGFADEPAALVTACRRLVDRHPEAGPMWWLASRVLASADPAGEAWKLAGQLDSDPTAATLAAHLPGDLVVTVLGWPELAADALRRRADLEVLVVDTLGDGQGLSRRLRASGTEAVDVPESGLGAAVAESGLLLLEASALGPDGFLAVSGSRAAASVARLSGVPTWVVTGVGRVLPRQLWVAMRRRLETEGDESWNRVDEVVPLELGDQLHGPDGPAEPASASARPDCPAAPELLKPIGG